MQKIGQNRRDDEISRLPDQRIKSQNTHKQIKRKGIEKIHTDINRPCLKIFSFNVAMALKNIITHGDKRDIDGNKILQNQRRIIRDFCKLEQRRKNAIGEYSIKSAHQKKADFLIDFEPNTLNFFIKFNYH